jgi:hypothetical protein
MIDQPKEGSREWIARVIRTHRLRAANAGPTMMMFSAEAPAEPADLIAADDILASLSR